MQTICPLRPTSCADYANKPITSRAHLLDVPSYLARHSLPPLNPLANEQISLATLKGIVRDCDLDIASGDLIVLHTGFFEALEPLSVAQRVALSKRGTDKGWAGVEATEDMLRWHWEQGIAAVATDT